VFKVLYEAQVASGGEGKEKERAGRSFCSTSCWTWRRCCSGLCGWVEMCWASARGLAMRFALLSLSGLTDVRMRVAALFGLFGIAFAWVRMTQWLSCDE
jgi:hypothetical protein